MAAKLRIGVTGMVHDHLWGTLGHAAERDDVELVAAADPNQPLRDKIAEEYGVESLYSDYHDLLEKEKPDAVFVYTDNRGGADVVEACAEAGVHAMVEKPMADRLANADRMLSAAEKSGIILMINYPSTWSPGIQHAYKLVEEGAIGQVAQLRMRCAHQGPKELGCSEYFYGWLYDPERNGAGALMDYCCYGCKVARWFLGTPNSVVATWGRLCKDYIDVEDNAFILMDYDRAIGIAEASWTQIGKVPERGPTFNGCAGTMIVRGDEVWLATTDDPEGTTIAAPDPPDHWRDPVAHFVWCLKNEKEPQGPSSAQICRDAQEILEAGILSCEQGRQIDLPL
ncbi:MAG: Gfo/Idh/MocA family protein [Armatimonadota bacterium]